MRLRIAGANPGQAPEGNDGIGDIRGSDARDGLHGESEEVVDSVWRIAWNGGRGTG